MKPNFFLIGFPKSGTTSLFTYLADHPEVCASQPKETNFWTSNKFPQSAATDLAHYESMFSFNPRAKAIGEASTFYIYSPEALNKINEYSPDAKIIIMVRNPIQLLYSLHGEAVRNLNEDVENFMEAWALQSERLNGRNLPQRNNNPQVYRYFENGRIGHHIQQAISIFGKNRILFLLIDDFKANPQTTYQQTLSFLGIADDGRQTFSRENRSRVNRSKSMTRLLTRPPKPIAWFIANRHKFGLKPMGVLSTISELNRTSHKTLPPMSSKFKQDLLTTFEDEIKIVEQVLNRELPTWRHL